MKCCICRNEIEGTEAEFREEGAVCGKCRAPGQSTSRFIVKMAAELLSGCDELDLACEMNDQNTKDLLEAGLLLREAIALLENIYEVLPGNDARNIFLSEFLDKAHAWEKRQVL